MKILWTVKVLTSDLNDYGYRKGDTLTSCVQFDKDGFLRMSDGSDTEVHVLDLHDNRIVEFYHAYALDNNDGVVARFECYSNRVR